MKQRLEYYGLAPELFEPLVALEKTLAKSSLAKELVELVKMRASQMNGCAYCLDMHLRDARRPLPPPFPTCSSVRAVDCSRSRIA